ALLKDADPEIRRETAQTLGRMGDEAKLTIPALARSLIEEKEGPVREAAAQALSGSMAPHSKTAVPELGKALKDSYAPARTAAALALKDLGVEAKPALPQLLELLKDTKQSETEFTARVYAAQLVGRLAADAEAIVPILAGIVAAKEENPLVRTAAAEALGRYGPKAESAADPLAQAVGDVKAD